jgi:hypothetical protein
VLTALPGTKRDPFGGRLVDEELLTWGLALAMSRSFGFKRVGDLRGAQGGRGRANGS